MALTTKMLRALPFVLGGDTNAEIARKARCSVRAVESWRANEEFMQVVSEFQDGRIAEVLQQAGTKLADATLEAVDELISMMRTSRQYPDVHLKTILAIIDRLQKIAEYRRPRGTSNAN